MGWKYLAAKLAYTLFVRKRLKDAVEKTDNTVDDNTVVVLDEFFQTNS